VISTQIQLAHVFLVLSTPCTFPFIFLFKFISGFNKKPFSIGVINIGLAISTARETIIESFETSYRRRVSEVAAKRLEYKKHKERQRARKMAIERMLHNAGLPLYIPDPNKPSKMILNEEALTPFQISSAENEALHFASKRANTANSTKFERTFSLESSKDSFNSEFDEENYKNFRRSIVKEERREFAVKVCHFCGALW